MTPLSTASPSGGLSLPASSPCPKCRASAQARPTAQVCGQCGTRFTLVAGKASDPTIRVPTAPPGARVLKLKAPGLVMVSVALLDPEWIGFGMLDPVVGAFPMDTRRVRFADIQTVCIWRALSLAQLLTFIFVSFPLGAACVAMVIASHFALPAVVVALPFLALVGFHGWRTFGVRATRTLVYERGQPALDMTFVGGLGKRRKFYGELCRRAGLPPIALP